MVYAGKDTFTGKNRYLREAAASEKEVEKLVTKLLNQVDEERQPRSSITVRQTIDKWFVVAEHERSTRKRLEQLLRTYLGSTQLSKVTAEDLERFYAALRRCKKLCNGRRKDHECKGLSNSSIRSMHFMLRAATDVAVRYNYVHVNAAALARPPSFKRPEPDPAEALWSATAGGAASLRRDDIGRVTVALAPTWPSSTPPPVSTWRTAPAHLTQTWLAGRPL